MSEFKGKRITVSADMHLDFPADEIWPLLCPVREYDWIEVWECELVHSESGFNESGCVFRTDFPSEGGKEVWLTCRYDLNERLEFVRTNAIRIIHFTATLTPEKQGTRLTWTQHVTALNEQGNAYMTDKPETFASQMAGLEKMLGHYLKTGEMLKGNKLGLMEKLKDHVHSGKTG